jgi:hypothetical protein
MNLRSGCRPESLSRASYAPASQDTMNFPALSSPSRDGAPRSARQKRRRDRLAAVFPSLARIFREVPGVTPRAQVGTKVLRRMGGCDLVGGDRQSFAFGSVLPLAADGTLRFVVHRRPSGIRCQPSIKFLRNSGNQPKNSTSSSPISLIVLPACLLRNSQNTRVVISWGRIISHA